MATLTAISVNTILQLISDLRGESSVNTDTSRIRAVSNAEQALARRGLFRIHLVKNQSIGTGDDSTQDFTVGSTTYPMRDKGVIEIWDGATTDNTNLRPIVDFTEYKRLINIDSNSRVAYEYYDQANDAWKVRVNPAPSSGNAVTASWYFIPPTRTSTSDNVLCVDPYVIAYLALADIYHSEDELQSEQLAKQEAEQRYLEAIGRESTPAINQTYRVSSGQRRGIGSY